jgi:hypothetical protein
MTAAAVVVDLVIGLVEDGLAYFVDAPMGYGYVVWDSVAARLRGFRMPVPEPVQYPILRGMTRTPQDCPLWAPAVDGLPSPYGNGYATVNLMYLVNGMKN